MLCITEPIAFIDPVLAYYDDTVDVPHSTNDYECTRHCKIWHLAIKAICRVTFVIRGMISEVIAPLCVQYSTIKAVADSVAHKFKEKEASSELEAVFPHHFQEY